jgi:dihydrofolate reductase
MKTILWATLSANGNYAQRYPSKEALDDFASYAEQSGNFITGRKTFDLIQTNIGRGHDHSVKALMKTEIVVLSKQASTIPGVTVVSSPRKALSYLYAKGHRTALVAGGESTHNAFLAEMLVDEIVFDIAPILESEGLKILLPKNGFAEVKLLGCRELGNGVVQLRYGIEKKSSEGNTGI